MEASTFTQQQFYTPSSSRDIDLIRTSPEYSSDPTTPTPPQTGATSTSYKILRHLDINAINPMSSEGALPDLSLAYANAHFDLEAFVERDDTEQQAALLECSHTSPPPRPNAPEDVASQRQSSSPGASLRQGALKRKRISTGELAPVERPWKRQFLVTDEHEPLAQRSTSPSSPAQLMTPSDNTVERSRKRSENVCRLTSRRQLTTQRRGCFDPFVQSCTLEPTWIPRSQSMQNGWCLLVLRC